MARPGVVECVMEVGLGPAVGEQRSKFQPEATPVYNLLPERRGEFPDHPERGGSPRSETRTFSQRRESGCER